MFVGRGMSLSLRNCFKSSRMLYPIRHIQVVFGLFAAPLNDRLNLFMIG